MAKRKRRRSKARRKKEIIWKLEAVAAVVLVCASLCISFLGGSYGIPTWPQLYHWLGVSNASPAPPPASAPAETPPPGSDGPANSLPAVTDETQIHFIDVGQGDAVLITNGGEYALIDCGTEECEEQLLAYLEQLGVTTLKLLVMTHPHADHIGSMDAVLQNIRVQTLLVPELTKAEEYPTTRTFERVLEAAEAARVNVQQAYEGAWYSIGAGTLTVLSTGIRTDNYNDISLCTRYVAGDFAFLDTGDAEILVEEKLLVSGHKLSSTVFKAAHHGSGTSNSLAFVAAVNPDIVVVSCGLDNSYGHPHDTPMENYITVGADIYQTDLQGSVVVTHTADAGAQVYTSR